MDQCEERVRLFGEVIKAVDAICSVRRKQNIGFANGGELATILQDALDSERRAVSALEQHRQQRGCKN